MRVLVHKGWIKTLSHLWITRAIQIFFKAHTPNWISHRAFRHAEFLMARFCEYEYLNLDLKASRFSNVNRKLFVFARTAGFALEFSRASRSPVGYGREYAFSKCTTSSPVSVGHNRSRNTHVPNESGFIHKTRTRLRDAPNFDQTCMGNFEILIFFFNYRSFLFWEFDE